MSRALTTICSAVVAVATLMLGGCQGCGDLYVVLTVEDPGGIASSATTLRLGEDPDAMSEVSLEGETFPVTQTQARRDAGEQSLWVEAADAQGGVLGRDHVVLLFEVGEPGTARAVLQLPCAEDVDCDDGVFCNGAETCTDRVCSAGAGPCPASVIECVQQGCSEAAGACTTEVDHDVCDGATYCNPAAGCIEGDPCTENGTEDVACQDGFTCNGAERCEGFHCVAGIPPSADDDSECTLDACAEPGGAINTPVPDGNACSLTAGASGICLTGTCVSSGCGDGYFDFAAGEECDDGAANSDTDPDACRTDCKASSCGDAVVDLGEACDDGNADDTDRCVAGCELARCGDGFQRADLEGCDDGVLNNDVIADACRTDCLPAGCGDGVADTGEACDDGDAEDEDGCLTTCELNVCGDGFVNFGVEDCDDANNVDTDGCVQGCVDASCGDTYVQADVEQCDDGNLISTDACLPGCISNICGDGVLNPGAESCDDGNTVSFDGCSGSCSFVAWAVDVGGALPPDGSLVAWSFIEYPPVPDAGTLPDAGPTPDAGPAPDAGPTPDAGPPMDAGADGGVDAGDAGYDAGSDAGYDAGPQPVSVRVVAAVTAGGEVVAIDTRDGSEIWRYDTGEAVSAPLARGTGVVFAITDLGTVVALATEPASLPVAPLWTRSLDRPSGGSHLAVSNAKSNPVVVAVDEYGKVYSFRGETGQPEGWQGNWNGSGDVPYTKSLVARDYDATATCVGCRPTLTNKTGALNNSLHYGIGGLLLPLGEDVWFWNFRSDCDPVRFPLPAGDSVLGPVVWRGNQQWFINDGLPSFLVSKAGLVERTVATDLGTCTPTLSVGGGTFHVALTTPLAVILDPYGADNALYVGGADDALHRLSWFVPSIGPGRFAETPGWPVPLSGPLRVGPAVGAEFGVYAASEDGALHKINLLAQLQWSMPLPSAPAGSPLIVDGLVFVGSQDGHVHAFERGETVAPPTWWAREGANNGSQSATPICSHVDVGQELPLGGLFLMGSALIALGVRRRRSGKTS